MTTKRTRTKHNYQLNDRQKRFIEAYLIDTNATAAAISAGYSKKSARYQANMLLQNPRIAEEIRKAQQARSARINISADDVAIRLFDVFKACAALVPCVDMLGENLYDNDGKMAYKPVDATAAVSAADKLFKHLGGYEKDNQQSKLDGKIVFEWMNHQLNPKEKTDKEEQ